MSRLIHLLLLLPSLSSFAFNNPAISRTESSAFSFSSSPPSSFSNKLLPRSLPSSSSPLSLPPSSTSLSAVPIPVSAISSLLLLTSIVTIHELGHFSAARLQNITVQEFSVGIGPKLLSADRDGIEYNLRALPLGGYVRFPEHYNFTLQEQRSEASFNQSRDTALAKGEGEWWKGNFVVGGKGKEEEKVPEKKPNPVFAMFQKKVKPPPEPVPIDMVSLCLFLCVCGGF